MAKLSGVKSIQERIEYNGKVYDVSTNKAEEGDIVRIDNEYRDYFTRGGYYVVALVGRNDIPHTYDDEGDLMPLWGDAELTIFKRTSSRQYREVKRAAKVGDRIRIVKAEDAHGKYVNGDELVVTGDRYGDGDIYVDSVKAPRNPSGFIFRREYVVLEPVESEESEIQTRLKVGEFTDGDYAKIVNATDDNASYTAVNNNGKYVIVYREVGADNYRGLRLVADGSVVGYANADALRKVSKAEFDRNQFAVGDKVRLISGGGEYPLYGFTNGEICEVNCVNYSRDEGKRIEIIAPDGNYGYATPDQLEKVAEEEARNADKLRVAVGDYVRITGNHTPNAGGPHAFSIGEIVKVCKVLSNSVLCDRVTDDRRQRISPINYEIITEEDAKWARIGRKSGEYKVGDLVRVIETYSGGYPEGTVGEVVEQPPYWIGGKRTAVEYNGEVRDHTGDVELVTPVESRFDKSA